MSVMALRKIMHFSDPSALETVCRFLNKCSLWEKLAELSLPNALSAWKAFATRWEHSLLSLAGFASVDKNLSLPVELCSIRISGQNVSFAVMTHSSLKKPLKIEWFGQSYQRKQRFIAVAHHCSVRPSSPCEVLQEALCFGVASWTLPSLARMNWTIKT